ncbi:adhesion G-protein coupled receptor G6 isoform X3 [Melanotaenia boesemani]|uniref:adhesion G-protein coupled receptor G6 isoform X3 n=1 Tax=Melanotaenia boesemani TaxID=1250792 RepID=UPI001C055302|nr:adhesion G-protein coupled receptor G6 isoform X3 [Melanotaenia boesemani]
MESCSCEGGVGWRLRPLVLVVLLWMSLQSSVLGCRSTNCNVVLTEAQGEFTSPCYPQKYPNSHSCKWTMQAPAGFIIQLSFLDFDLEEAQGCIYDWVVVNTGNTDVKFCGLTANGLTLNSTGNVMELSFTSDFSVQKRGFSVSFQHVAVALRNQKVKVTGSNSQVTTVANSVSIPTLTELTICFEAERRSQKQEEWLFTYDDGNHVGLSFGFSHSEMKMVIDGVVCSLASILTSADFTSTMRLFCVLWSSSDGQVAVYFGGNHLTTTCPSSSQHSVPAGGSFRLGGQQNFNGNIYNLRLWNRAMTVQELSVLTCDVEGDVIDWDNSHWSIPSSLAETDNTLSCSANIALTTSCDSPELGCPAASSPTTSSTVSTNTIHATNVITDDTFSPTISFTETTNTIHTFHAITTYVPPSIHSTASPSTSMPLTPPNNSTTSSTSSSSSSSAEQITSITATLPSAPTNHPATNPTKHGSSPLLLFLTTTQPATNIAETTVSSLEGLFYRASFVVESELSLQAVEQAVAQWLNQTFESWTHAVKSISIHPDGPTQQNSIRYTCQVLLVISNENLDKANVSLQLSSRTGLASSSLQVQPASIEVQLIENCQEDSLLHYRWPQTRPGVTQYLPCFPNKDQSASRICLIDPENLSSYWSAANFTSCAVTAENAADVAEQLANFTKNNLSEDEVSQVVTKVQELVNVARIDTTVAETVVNIISNVMVSSKLVLVNSSRNALRAVEELAQKVEFEGPSINITSRYLALGILALNTTTFNGTSFSAFIPPNSSDPKIEFELTDNPLGQVALPSSLLSGVSLSESDRSSLSRINFVFFSSTNLFKKEQTSLSLNSYVVASSVANFSITDLKDPVRIEIAHLSDQTFSSRLCVFWDFSMSNGDGGWNSTGCSVSSDSNSNRTVCLCNHLTHFGILMDVSQASSRISPVNLKILTFLSYIGCGISAVCSAATLLTYIAFEKLRRDYPSKILMNLSTSLLFLNMVFLLDGWLASVVSSEGLCLSAAVLLHYFLLTSFTWMGLESVHMYIALVKVFNTYIRRYILKFCIVGWGLPAVLVGIVVTVNKNYYGILEDGEDESGKMCWIREMSVFYTTCVGYFCLVFLLNVAMFVVVMMQICGRNGKRSNRTLREEVLRNLRSVVSLTFLLGMTWGFALFAWGPVYLAFTYLFTIFNSLQGLFIFIFHCALKENVQKQWRRYLCCGPYRLSDNSDWSKTATNNTKKVSSENLAKSLSSSSFGSSTANWTSKAKATLTPFTKRNRNPDKCYSIQTGPKCISSCSSSSDVEPCSSSSSSSILPVSQMIDKVKGYCSTRTDNFYKNIIMSDSFANCTRL